MSISVGEHVAKNLYLLLVLLLAACSSTHDLKRDGLNFFGGGFIDEQVGPGLYLVKAFSNMSPIPTPDSAARTFLFRAKQLCPAGYEEVRTVADAYESSSAATVVIPDIKRPGLSVVAPPPVVTSKIGHIRCIDSPLTLYEAKAFVSPESEQ